MRRAACLVLLAACHFETPAGVGGRDADAGDDAAADATDAPADTAIDGPRADWFDPAWRHRVPVTIDNTKLSAGVMTSFPVLVTLPASVDVGATGAALRFVSQDNTTEYAYDIDTLTPGGPTLVWVAIPTLSNAGEKPVMWAYYDNPAAAAPETSAQTFSTRFDSVHHLGTSLADATGRPHTATATGTTAVAGKIGLARNFTGSDFLELPREQDFDFTAKLYVSCWVKVAAFDQMYQAIVTKGDSAWRLARAANGNAASLGTSVGGVNDNLSGTANINDGQWHLVAASLDGAMAQLWVDGALDASVVFTASLDTNNYAVRIGMNQQASSPRYWKGQIDELRISSGQRDTKWVKAEYITVTDPTFVTVGSPEPY